ncbi:MAG: electron transport complex subunit RsxG [Sulfuritalea sp.]|nr:electron transport complex subunit RsxG [Sulfuritalea sp.]MDP1983353.1 electron transport complex subunit RsxG [Sulfuritalea sp.]
MSLDFAATRERLPYQGISLGIMALLASAALVFANHATREAIAAAAARDLQTSLAQVLPAGFADNDMLADTLQVGGSAGKRVYRARRQGAVTGAVFQTAARGYAGDVVVLIGVDRAGMLLGARVIKHSETPGLGDKIDAAKSKWILGFDGKSLDNLPAGQWAVKKDGGAFDQFAGATITPRAVVKAVKGGLDFYAAHRAEIIAEGNKP